MEINGTKKVQNSILTFNLILCSAPIVQAKEYDPHTAITFTAAVKKRKFFFVAKASLRLSRS